MEKMWRERGGRKPRRDAPMGSMGQSYRDMARGVGLGGLPGSADFGDYRGGYAGADFDSYGGGYEYDQPMRGPQGYRNHDPMIREGLLGNPLAPGGGGGGGGYGGGGAGGGYFAGRSTGYSGGGGHVSDRETELMDHLLQQRLLEQQLSLREKQLALTNALLMQQGQLQNPQLLAKGLKDEIWGEDMGDLFKQQRVIYNHAQPQNRSGGQDSSTRGKSKGTRGGPGGRQNQGGYNGYSGADAERMQQEAPKKFRKPKAGGKKDMENGADGRHPTSAANSRDSLKSKAGPKNFKTVGTGSADKSKGPKKINTNMGRSTGDDQWWCAVCELDCGDFTGVKKHRSSAKHQQRAANLRNRSSSKSDHSSHADDDDDYHDDDDDDNYSKQSKGYCYTCDVPLKVPFKIHQRFTRHKLQVERKKNSRKHLKEITLGCGWCKVASFKNFADVLAHRATEQHIKNQELYGKKGKAKGEASANSTKTKEDIKVELPPELAEHDPEVMVGEACMLEVTGWFCTACRKFCNSEKGSKQTHCSSLHHFNSYRKFLTSKLKREARKAAEEEQEKKEDETAAAAAAAAENDNKDSDSGADVKKDSGETEEKEEGDESGEKNAAAAGDDNNDDDDDDASSAAEEEGEEEEEAKEKTDEAAARETATEVRQGELEGEKRGWADWSEKEMEQTD